MFFSKTRSGFAESKIQTIKSVISVALLAALISLSPQPTKANLKYAAFVYDANQGKVLFARNADKHRFPASLTKVMTLYLVFDAIDAGKITLNSKLKVSRRAAGMPPSKLYLKAGGHIRVRDAILALVTKSANDVASTVAENLGGTEAKFARMMTLKAHSLGMTNTSFANASGLPNTRQRTTARDMVRLGLAIRKNHPRSFRYFATRSFKYGGRSFSNHNRLLGRVNGVNGIKTGYIRASGFNLLSNVETRGKHLVAVVMGGRSGRSRNDHMTTLINRYIGKASPRNLKDKQTPLLVAEKGLLDTVPIPVSRAKSVPAFAAAHTPAPEVQPVSAQSPVIIAASLIAENTTEDGPTNAALGQVFDNKTAQNAAANSSQAALSDRPNGWKIQLSAAPTLENAENMLIEAAQSGAAVLAHKTPYTERVEKDGDTLYRVRFAGFSDKHQARRACDFMIRKRYRCIYLN